MDQETARVLFREGGTLLFLDMPEGSEFGIDYNSWTVGPKFRGVKMIPPGIHYIYYRYKIFAFWVIVHAFVVFQRSLSGRFIKLSNGLDSDWDRITVFRTLVKSM